jgi:hypothetical protein
MLDLDHCLSALHRFAWRAGAPVDYAALPSCLGGCLDRGRIVLSAGLAPEQELLTLVHELTHVMAHIACTRSRTERTVCEYEAEAVEWLIAQRLGIGAAGFESFLGEAWTFPDGLLADSAARVGAVASTLLAVLDREPLAGFTPSCTHLALQGAIAAPVVRGSFL